MTELVFLVIVAVLLVALSFLGVSAFSCVVTFLAVPILLLVASHWFHRFLLKRAVRADKLRVSRFGSFRGTISLSVDVSIWETNEFYSATLVSEDGTSTEYLVSVNGYLFGLFGATIQYGSLE